MSHMRPDLTHKEENKAWVLKFSTHANGTNKDDDLWQAEVGESIPDEYTTTPATANNQTKSILNFQTPTTGKNLVYTDFFELCFYLFGGNFKNVRLILNPEFRSKRWIC